MTESPARLEPKLSIQQMGALDGQLRFSSMLGKYLPCDELCHRSLCLSALVPREQELINRL
eukprot:gene21246-8039_t